MKTDELREKYLSFFETKGHARRPSDVLVPTWDPSVLFTPAGMNQFKDHFLGKVKLDFSRATTSQKCLRTGDIDNVGRTAYHHTFFEMLGNFSFGDYFKRDAINWAWEFLTQQKWLGIDPDRLTISVYVDDDEAAAIWADDIGLTQDRIQRMGEEDNFWPASAPSQGPDGVCGPCSEIFYRDDQGCEVEIWNLVFTQFNRVGPPPGNLRPLPSRNIDTGMGLERTAAALQGVDTNFHIDILLPIVEAAAEVCRVPYDPASDNGRRLRRITDHVRACTFAIHENVYPGSNKERYVVRRLLRRAVLDGHQIGCREPFLSQVVPRVVEVMKGPYPELAETAHRVQQAIHREEEAFFATIDDGLTRIDTIFADAKKRGQVVVSGAHAAELYQTYGVPPDLVESMAAEQNMTFDWRGFRAAMEQHEDKSRAEQKKLFKTGPVESLKRAIQRTEFVGYEATECDAVIKGIADQEQLYNRIREQTDDRSYVVVLDRSPFYGESGGQVGDKGELVGKGFRFCVADTQTDGDLILHAGTLAEGEMAAGCPVTARVDIERRDAIRRAHSATHILHHALRMVLGNHAQQQGSKVDEDWLRFDFTNLAPVNAGQLAAVETEVAAQVAAGKSIRWQYLPLEEARVAGAMMLFGEKYPDPVRMVSMGSFSKELCGGTHLDNTTHVGAFDIVGEDAVAAGTRRITALTGARAQNNAERTKDALAHCAEQLGVEPLGVSSAARRLVQTIRELRKHLASGNASSKDRQAAVSESGKSPPTYAQVKTELHDTARLLNVSPFDAPTRIESMQAEVQSLKEQLAELSKSGVLTADSLLKEAQPVGDTKVVVREMPSGNPKLMRQLIDQLRKKADSVAVLLAARQGEGKVMLIAGMSRELVERGASAGDWVKQVAPIVGGGGGGKPDMAQAGGKQPENLPQALETALHVVRQMLGQQGEEVTR